VTTREQDETSPRVPVLARKGEETEQRRENRWSFVEPAIWTERMIAALETGVKGGALAQCLLRRPRAVHHDRGPEGGRLFPMRKRPTGEPDAGDPHVRFGGEGASAPLPNRGGIGDMSSLAPGCLKG